MKRGVVEAEFFEGVAELRVFGVVAGIEVAEDHLLGFAVAWEGLGGGVVGVGDGVADGDILDGS